MNDSRILYFACPTIYLPVNSPHKRRDFEKGREQVIEELQTTQTDSTFTPRLPHCATRRNDEPKNVLRILTYHRVADAKTTPHLHPRIISARPELFARQMRHLAKNYCVISMEEVLDAWERKAALPAGAVLITFDDGYLDFGEVAWPILQYYRLPVTLFVPTAYPDQPQRAFWWDRLYRAISFTPRSEWNCQGVGAFSLQTPEQRTDSLRALQKYVKTLPHVDAMQFIDRVCDELGEDPSHEKTVLGWEELRQLSKQGVTIAAHTQTHPIMHRLTADAVQQEISGSLMDLQREIGDVLPVFCYPDGGHDDGVVGQLQKNGVKLAFTTLRGLNHLGNTDPLRLRRNNITPRSSLPIFKLRLLHLMAYLESWRD